MTKTLILFLFTLSFSTVASFSQDIKVDWVNAVTANSQFGSNWNDLDKDAVGNIYFTISYRDTLVFDSATSNGVLISPKNTYEAIVGKLDKRGKYKWFKSFEASVRSIKLDNNGSLYVTGVFADTVDFNPAGSGGKLFSPRVTRFPAIYNGFILQLDTNGNFISVKHLKGKVYPKSIKTVKSGDLIIAGRFEGIADFDPSSGTHIDTAVGQQDAFVLKIGASGSVKWLNSLEGLSLGDAIDVSIDDSGNVFTVGWFTFSLDADPDTSTMILTSAGDRDVFVQKVDSNGHLLWAKSIGSSQMDEAQSIKNDRAGNVYISGNVRNADLDPGSGIKIFDRAFILKLNSLGNYCWARSVPTSVFDTDVQLDSLGYVYAYNTYLNQISYSDGTWPPKIYNKSKGSSDVLIQKLDSSGNLIWFKSIGGTGSERTLSFQVGNNGSIYCMGQFQDTVDFDPNSGVHNLISKSGFSYYFQKLEPCKPTSGKEIITACDSIKWKDGYTYNKDTIGSTFKIPNMQGCDSTLELNLKIYHSNFWIDTVLDCSNYNWIDGKIYKSNNDTSTYRLVNQYGCDSIIRLQLIIDRPAPIIDTINACDSYMWVDSIFYTTNNYSARDTLLNINGCDSIVQLALTITEIDSSIYTTDTSIFSVVQNATFQWVNCVDYSFIQDAIESHFTPVLNGNYALLISKNGCTDSSSCISFTVSSIKTEIENSHIEVYPNPSSGRIFLKLNKLETVNLSVWSSLGQILLEKHNISQEITEIDLGFYKGNVIIKISNENYIEKYHLIIE